MGGTAKKRICLAVIILYFAANDLFEMIAVEPIEAQQRAFTKDNIVLENIKRLQL